MFFCVLCGKKYHNIHRQISVSDVVWEYHEISVFFPSCLCIQKACRSFSHQRFWPQIHTLPKSSSKTKGALIVRVHFNSERTAKINILTQKQAWVFNPFPFTHIPCLTLSNKLVTESRWGGSRSWHLDMIPLLAKNSSVHKHCFLAPFFFCTIERKSLHLLSNDRTNNYQADIEI